ncbi:MAG: hypothetical protein ACREJQ_01985, partial [bacterium]
DDDPKTIDWIPGEFLYRAHPMVGGWAEGPWILIDSYLLGAYGSTHRPGLDLLHCGAMFNPTGGLRSGETHFGPAPAGISAADPCKVNRRDAFDPRALAREEPAISVGLRGFRAITYDPNYLPNVVFRLRSPNDTGIPPREYDFGNPDGRPDGIIAVFTSADPVEEK